MKITTPTKLTKAAEVKLLKDETTSKSHKMKELFAAGYSIKEIATKMEVRYNFVYNVISNHITINGIEVESSRQGNNKKDQIIALHLEGKTKKEISATTQSNYSYVYTTIKKYEAQNGEEEAAK